MYLANILGPLVGDTPHHVKNSAEFASKIQDLTVTPGKKLLSYDVSALFTTIPVPEAIQCVKSTLESVDTWKDRTRLTLEQIIRLLDFVLLATYFVCRGTIYKQVLGCAMGPPVYIPIIANFYMEHLEREALTTFPRPPENWYSYVDDIFYQAVRMRCRSFYGSPKLIESYLSWTTVYTSRKTDQLK